MPVPIMFETTSAVALKTPSCRRREGLEVATAYVYSTRLWFALLHSPVALLVFLAAAARAGIVAPGFLRRHLRIQGRGGRFRPRAGRLGFVVMIVFIGLFSLEHRSEPMQPQPFVERKHDQLGLGLRKRRDGIDLAQHALDAPARGFARHGERVSKQRIVAQIVIRLGAIEKTG